MEMCVCHTVTSRQDDFVGLSDAVFEISDAERGRDLRTLSVNHVDIRKNDL